LDLELYANHRGSIFGKFLDAPQPAQITFENSIGMHLFEREWPTICEAESRMIGTCAIPNTVKAAMDDSEMVLMKEPVEVRAKNIFDEYVTGAAGPEVTESRWIQVKVHFHNCLSSISRRLGGAMTETVRNEMAQAFSTSELAFERHAPWISLLLEKYYDQLYEHSLKMNQRRIVFEGNWKECRDFISSRTDRWRT
jgi:tRNA 2-selenouridine synthase